MFNFPISPPQASTFAKEYDLIYYALWALTFVFTALVVFFIMFFAIKYRAGTRVDRSSPVYEDSRLELGSSAISLVLGLVVFYFGARLFIKMRTPPKDAEEIFVIGKQWMWHVQHANGVRENNTLHVPVGRPVKISMISQDVLHAFYIPAFRTQMHVVPGRYTDLWFTATKEGEYHIFCNMYCGLQHSEMGGTAVVMSQKDYAEWLANNGTSVANTSMEQAGAKLFNVKGCNNCHGSESNLRGPSLVGIYGSKRVFTDGTTMVGNEDYIRESILRPYNHITAGYGRSMPAYESNLSEEEVLNIISYIKSMGMASADLATTGVSREKLASGASVTGKTKMAANAEQYNAQRSDATPTNRGKDLAVGAIAADKTLR